MMAKKNFTRGIPVSAVVVVVIGSILGLLVLPDCARLNVIVINSTADPLENVSVTGGVARGYAHWSGRLEPSEVRHIYIRERVGTDLRLQATSATTGRVFDAYSPYASTSGAPGETFFFLVEDFAVHTGKWKERVRIDPLGLGSYFFVETACIDYILWSRFKGLIARLLDKTE